MRTIVKIFLGVILLIYISTSFAQDSNDTLNITGNVSLDFSVAQRDYIVEVTVSNHSFIVIPPGFTIIRPLLSRVRKSVTIPQGQSSIDYEIEGISVDAANYVIDFRCENCNGVFTPQYYTKKGNSFFRNNDIFLDPEDLPTNLNFILTSGVSITGLVSLPDGNNASKDLMFLLSVIDSSNPINVLRRMNIIIPKGNNSSTYSIDGIVRETGLVGFDLALECINCTTGSTLLINHSTTLDSSTDHTDIDFVVDFQDTTYLPAVLHLLNETLIN